MTQYSYEEMKSDYFDAHPEMKKHLENGCDVDWQDGIVLECVCSN